METMENIKLITDRIVELTDLMDKAVYMAISGLDLDSPKLDTFSKTAGTFDSIRRNLRITMEDSTKILELAQSIANLTRHGIIGSGSPVAYSAGLEPTVPTLRAMVANRTVAIALLSSRKQV